MELLLASRSAQLQPSDPLLTASASSGARYARDYLKALILVKNAPVGCAESFRTVEEDHSVLFSLTLSAMINIRAVCK